METIAFLRIEFENQSMAERAIKYFDPEVFVDEDAIPNQELPVFNALEFSEKWGDLKRFPEGFSGWVPFIELDDLSEILTSLSFFCLKKAYLLFQNDEEYRAYFIWNSNRLIELYSEGNDSRVDSELERLESSESRLEMIIQKYQA